MVEEKQKKQPNLKISKILMLIGAIVLVSGIILLVSSISSSVASWNEYNALETKYEEEYNIACEKYEDDLEAYRENFMNGNQSVKLPDIPIKKQADFPLEIGTFIFAFFSSMVVVAGGCLIVSGAKPYIIKLKMKKKMETLDYAGDAMTEVGKKVVDIGAPVINKAVDDVVAPTVKKIKEAVVSDKEEVGKQKQIYCKHCGYKIDIKSKFCQHCGKEQ